MLTLAVLVFAWSLGTLSSPEHVRTSLQLAGKIVIAVAGSFHSSALLL